MRSFAFLLVGAVLLAPLVWAAPPASVRLLGVGVGASREPALSYPLGTELSAPDYFLLDYVGGAGGSALLRFLLHDDVTAAVEVMADEPTTVARITLRGPGVQLDGTGTGLGCTPYHATPDQHMGAFALAGTVDGVPWEVAGQIIMNDACDEW